MDILLEIQKSNKDYNYYVTEGFYEEAGKEDPLIIIWMGDKATNTICITNEEEYRKYFKKCLMISFKNRRLEKLPEVIYFVNDKNTSIKIYNILNYNASNSLQLIIDALNSQPFKLIM